MSALQKLERLSQGRRILKLEKGFPFQDKTLSFPQSFLRTFDWVLTASVAGRCGYFTQQQFWLCGRLKRCTREACRKAFLPHETRWPHNTRLQHNKTEGLSFSQGNARQLQCPHRVDTGLRLARAEVSSVKQANNNNKKRTSWVLTLQ